MFFAVVFLALGFVTSSLARDPVVDVLVSKGIVSEDEIAAAEAEAVKTTWQTYSRDITMGGYVQAWYTWVDEDAGVDDTFSVGRLYWWMRGDITDKWSVFVGPYLSHDFMLLDAMVKYEHADWLNISAGQFLLPYSYEQLTSSSRIDTIQRAQVTNMCSNHRDIGVRANGAFAEGKVSYGAAMVNGNGINTTDDNDKKDVIGRVQVQPFLDSESSPLTGLLVAGAFQYGEQPWIVTTVDPATGASVDTDIGDEKRTRYLGTVIWNYDKFKVQGEFAQEELEDTNVTMDGYYVLATYDVNVDSMIVQPVVKYEEFDPNDAITNDETTITTVGANLFFGGKKSRLALNYRLIDEEPEVDNNELLAMWQHIF